MRRGGASVSFVIVALAAAVACSSFEDSGPTPGGDAGTDSPTADAPGPADGAAPESGEAAAGDGGVPAFVQSNSTSVTNLMTASVGLPLAVQEHGTIVVAFSINTTANPGIAPPQVTDGADTFVQMATVTNGPVLHYLFLADDVRAGAVTVSVTSNKVASEIQLYVHEYGGLAAKAFIDGKTTVAASGCDDAADCPATVPMAAPARSLLFGYCVTDAAGVGTGFTARETRNANVTEDRVVTVDGSYPVTARKKTGTSYVLLGAVLRAR